MISVKMSRESNEVFISIGKLREKNAEALAKGFDDLGKALVRRVQNTTLNEVKHGRNYRVKTNRGVYRIHRASSPGQTPAIISGDYHDGVKYQADGANGLRFYNDVDYSKYLEYGTPKMKKRSGMLYGIQGEMKNGRMLLEGHLRKAFE